MTVTISDSAWKWAAVALFLILIGYMAVWPRLNAGVEAYNYINRCIEAGVCPTPQQLSQRLAPPAPTTPIPAPSPSPSPAPKGK